MSTQLRIAQNAFTPLATVLACLLFAASATALSPERHYEMVSPAYKAGYGVNEIYGMDSDGQAMAYTSYGAFAGAPADQIGAAGAGNPYVAVRDSTGWSTTPLAPPASLFPYGAPGLTDFSSDFTGAVYVGKSAPNVGAGQYASTEYDVYVHPTLAPDLSEYFTPVRKITVPEKNTPSYTGASADLSQIVIESTREAPLTPEAVGTTMERAQYVLRSKTGSISFLALNNASPPKPIDPRCNVDLAAHLQGSGLDPSNTATNTISADGSEIFFHTCADSATYNTSTSEQLFVRLNGERTLEVSRPLEPCVGEGNGIPGEVPCQGAATRSSAKFDGASDDGSKVFFATREPLLGEETHGGVDLYMARIGCPITKPGCEVAQREVTGLTRITRPLNSAETGGQQGVVTQSLDGSHLYFVALGVLSGANAEGHAPVSGADNLYVYDSDTETVTFIAELCSSAGISGERQDRQCPGDLDTPHGHRGGSTVNDAWLWESVSPEAQTADNGRFLLFSSYAQLTSDDTDDARDVFRYDALTGTIVRISVGEAGYHANGNGDNEIGRENLQVSYGNADASIAGTFTSEPHPRRQSELNSRAISEDGSRIVFATEEPLSQAAINGLLNGYEWHDGQVSLVSSGTDEEPVGQTERMAITPSGDDIFFMTTQRLLPAQDSDEVADIYDARIGPGFPVTPGGTERCKGETCQGALMPPAPVLSPAGSATQTAEETVTAPSTKTTSRKKARPGKPAGKRGRGHHRKRSSRKRAGAHKANSRSGR